MIPAHLFFCIATNLKSVVHVSMKLQIIKQIVGKWALYMTNSMFSEYFEFYYGFFIIRISGYWN